MPDTPECTVITYNDLYAAGSVTPGKKLSTGQGNTITAMLANDANYSVCKLNVSDRKKVRFPSVMGTNLVGAVFADSAGNAVSTMVVSTIGHKFADGMYLIADVPAIASWLHFTILNTAEFDCCILSDSDKIEDMEPDWVEHPACLTGAFQAVVINSKLRSAISGTVPTNGYSQSEFHLSAANRHLQLVDYEMHKDIANLFFAFYGRRDSQSQCGFGKNGERTCGGTVLAGMKDTVNLNNATENAWYTVTDESGAVSYVQIPSNNCLGYEDWFGTKREWMDNIIMPNDSVMERLKWNIIMPDGTTRKVKTVQVDYAAYISGVVHQKYMDVIAVFGSAASATTYYCDTYSTSVSANRVPFRNSDGFSSGSGLIYMHGSVGAGDKYYSSDGTRIAFRGQIVTAASVTAYKALNAIY
jgi:hypothetical protein